MFKKYFSLAAMLTVALLVFGCGDSGDGEEEEATPAGDSSPTASAGPLSIEHAKGVLELDGPAKRVVALEWTYAEDLLAVGVQPAGAADISGYNTWLLTEPSLGPDVVDVGTRQQPSLEQIAALDPDLIIAVKFRHEAAYDDLSAIAPTLLFDSYPAEGTMTQYEEMEKTFRAVAKAVGKEEAAEAVLDDLDAEFEKASADLEAADLATTEFALVQAFTSQGTPAMRLFTDNAMASGILEKIGLTNANEGGFELYGFSTGGVESLVAVQDANFLYIVQDDDNIFETALKENPVWTQLAFVKEDRTFPLGGDTWTFGGPLSAGLLVDKTVAALAGGS